MYQCVQCNFVCLSLKKYVHHMSTHRNVPNFRFECGVPCCTRTFASYLGFNTHVSRHHRGLRGCWKQGNLEIDLKCNHRLCHKSFNSVSDLISHIKSHLSSGGFIQCCFKGCSKTFKVKSSFSSHLSRCHRNKNKNLIASQYLNPTPNESPLDEDIFVPEDSVVIEQDNSNPISSHAEEIRNAALFCLLLESKCLIPSKTVQLITEELSHLLIREESYFDVNFSKKLNMLTCLDDTEKQEIMKSAKESHFLKSIFDSELGLLKSNYLRQQYYENNMKFVKPVEISIGRDEGNCLRYCHYIPIKKTLVNLLQDTTVKLQIQNPLEKLPNRLNDFTDGSLFQQHPTESSATTLQLILFQDAFEIVNPLGSSRNKHKILGVYFTLGNFYPQYRSSVNQMQLLMLCRDKDFKLFGQRAIFQQLLDDLKEIENGFDVNGIRYIGRVFCITSDNLGAHFIGGFSQNFSTSEYMCRYCIIRRETWSNQDYPHLSAPSRTVENYNSSALELSVNGQGIVFPSLFNELQHFHVCLPGLPPCLGHDLFEGVCDYDLTLCINYFICKGWLTYELFNSLITDFDFSRHDSNCKPSMLRKKSNRLNGNACQNWALLRFLPVLLYGKIDFEDSVWKLVAMLREVVEFVCAPSISYAQIAYMKILIDEYLEARKVEFKDVPLRPKHHFLQHYPELTMKFGPLIRLWTLRFESKHSYFKNVARRCRNFKNVTASLSHKHQLLQAFLLSGNLFSGKLCVENSQAFNPELYSTQIQNAIKEAKCEESLYITDKITIYGTAYSLHQFLHIINEEINDCVFGEILFILTNKDTYFVVKLWSGNWCSDNGLYFCTGTQTVTCVKFENLGDFYPLSCYSCGNEKLIALKHKFFSNH